MYSTENIYSLPEKLIIKATFVWKKTFNMKRKENSIKYLTHVFLYVKMTPVNMTKYMWSKRSIITINWKHNYSLKLNVFNRPIINITKQTFYLSEVRIVFKLLNLILWKQVIIIKFSRYYFQKWNVKIIIMIKKIKIKKRQICIQLNDSKLKDTHK